jgi:sortase A
MTAVLDPPEADDRLPPPPTADLATGEAPGAPPAERPWTPRRIALQAAGWVAVILVATVLVAYPLGPVFQQREQHQLLRQFRTEIVHAANDEQGLAGLLDTSAAPAPRPGEPVGILDIGDLHLRQVVVEGADATNTSSGPGHLPGSAGLGQPGNAVVVGRNAAWGGPFDSLDSLRRGQLIVTSTTQGQSVYKVTSVKTETVNRNDLGPTDDDRLTLITSASGWPSSSTRGTVVRAKLVGVPFEPTAQGTRPAGIPGHLGDPAANDRLVLCLLVFTLAAVGAAKAHRTWKPLVAHLLTTPALVVLAIVTAETATRFLPAWS